MRIESKWGPSIFLTERNRRDLRGHAVPIYKEVDNLKVRAGDATIVEVRHTEDGGLIFTFDVPDELADLVQSSPSWGAVSFGPDTS